MLFSCCQCMKVVTNCPPKERAISEIEERERERRAMPLVPPPLASSFSSFSSSSSSRCHRGPFLPPPPPPRPGPPPARTPSASCLRSPPLARPRPRPRRTRKVRLSFHSENSAAAESASAAFRCSSLSRLRHCPAPGSSLPAASRGSRGRLQRLRCPRRQSGAGKRPRGRVRGPVQQQQQPLGRLLLLPTKSLSKRWRRPALPACGPRPGRPRGWRSPAGAAPV